MGVEEKQRNIGTLTEEEHKGTYEEEQGTLSRTLCGVEEDMRTKGQRKSRYQENFWFITMVSAELTMLITDYVWQKRRE